MPSGGSQAPMPVGLADASWGTGASIDAPPPNGDTLEWVLFEYKQGYCVYYASLDVLMLRSLGIRYVFGPLEVADA